MKALFVSYNYPGGTGHAVFTDFDEDFQIKDFEDIRMLQKSINRSFKPEITDDPTKIIIENFKWLPY